jgi:hypothetical protein
MHRHLPLARTFVLVLRLERFNTTLALRNLRFTRL